MPALTISQQLEQILSEHPYFERHTMKAGILEEIRQLHHIRMSEMEEAVLNIMQRSDITDPIGALKRFGFKNGKCNIFPPAEKKEPQDAPRASYELPGWKDAWTWFQGLEWQYQDDIKSYIMWHLKNVFCQPQYASDDLVFSARSIGRVLLVRRHQLMIDKNKAQFVMSYSHHLAHLRRERQAGGSNA